MLLWRPLAKANHLKEASVAIQELLDKDKISKIVSLIPEDWLVDKSISISTSQMRTAYIEFLTSKLNNIDLLVKEAMDAK